MNFSYLGKHTFEQVRKVVIISCPKVWAHFPPWLTQYCTLYTHWKLRNLHLHFMQPLSEKLFYLPQSAYPSRICAGTHSLLDRITNSCHACQLYSSKPLTFKFWFRDDVVFNNEFWLDLFYHDGHPVLHVIDTDTNFLSTRFIAPKSSTHVWYTFILALVSNYMVYPEPVLADQGSNVFENDSTNQCEKLSINLH